MVQIIKEYSPHIGLVDKGLKVASYGAQAWCLATMLCGRTAQIQKLAQLRQVTWGIFAVRDLAGLPAFLKNKDSGTARAHFVQGTVLIFRGIFFTRSALKIANWLRPCQSLLDLEKSIGKAVPYFILTFSTTSLINTAMKEKRDVKDWLSVGDNLAEMVCTSLESIIPGTSEAAQWTIAITGMISGSCSFAKLSLVLNPLQSSEEGS